MHCKLAVFALAGLCVGASSALAAGSRTLLVDRHATRFETKLTPGASLTVRFVPPHDGRWVALLTERQTGTSYSVASADGMRLDGPVTRYSTTFIALSGATEVEVSADDMLAPPGPVFARIEPLGDAPVALLSAIEAIAQGNAELAGAAPVPGTALRHYERAVTILGHADHPLAVHVRAEAAHAAGELSYALGDSAAVNRHYRLAARDFEALQRHAEQATALASLSLWDWETQQFDRALDLADRSVEAATLSGDDVRVYMSRHNRCLVLLALGETTRARQCATEVAAAAQASGDLLLQVTANNTLSGAHSRTGRPDLAIEPLQRTIAALKTAGQVYDLGIYHNNLAMQYRRLGDTQSAIEQYGLALELQGSDNDRTNRAVTLRNLAFLYLLSGDVDRAEGLYRASLDIVRTLDRPADEAELLLGLANVELARQAHDQALALLQQAAAAAARTDNSLLHILIGNREATTHLRAGDPATALSVLKRLQADHARFDAGLIARGQTALLLGQAYLETDAVAAADTELARAERLFREARYALGLALALESRALSALRLGDHAGVEKLAREAIDVYSVLRGRLTNLDLRANYASQQFRPANVYVKSLMQRHRSDPDRGYDARALEVAERARARTLLEVLNDSDADRSGVNAEILARRTRLLREISANAEPTQPSAARSRGDLIELLSELDELESRIAEQTRPGLGRIAAVDLSIEDVQAALHPGELLLYYFIGDDEVFAWAVSADTAADGVSLGESRAIELAARKTARDLRELGRVEAGLKQLSDLVLGPFAAAMNDASRLVIVTDGALNYVPFEALPAPGTSTRLLDDFVVSYAPSVATLSVLRAATPGGEREPLVLAVSDPVFSLRDRRVGPGEPGDGESRRGQTLNRLALTALEADAIEALVPDGRLIDLTGLEANRGTLLEALTARQPDIVHIATHGFVDTDRPELTGISLSIDPAAAAAAPSFIGLRDIYLLDLSARLVVLSACETALGRELKSEGLVGLTRAFLYAGARQVIASLWQVQDRSTSELMRRLYGGYLGDGLDAAEALRAAKQEVRANPRWRHPYYWSGFVLQGH